MIINNTDGPIVSEEPWVPVGPQPKDSGDVEPVICSGCGYAYSGSRCWFCGR